MTKNPKVANLPEDLPYKRKPKTHKQTNRYKQTDRADRYPFQKKESFPNSTNVTLEICHTTLPVKTQYLKYKNTVHTFINCKISGQFTPMVKGCMNIMFNGVDSAFLMEDYRSSTIFFMNFSR